MALVDTAKIWELVVLGDTSNSVICQILTEECHALKPTDITTRPYPHFQCPVHTVLGRVGTYSYTELETFERIRWAVKFILQGSKLGYLAVHYVLQTWIKKKKAVVAWLMLGTLASPLCISLVVSHVYSMSESLT